MKKAVMYGAGSVGRGFMAELFDRSGSCVSYPCRAYRKKTVPQETVLTIYW